MLLGVRSNKKNLYIHILTIIIIYVKNMSDTCTLAVQCHDKIDAK